MDLSVLEQLGGRRVLVTGDTGFKGSWLCMLLHHLGAEVHGFALPPEPGPCHWELCRVAELVDHVDGDVRDLEALQACFRRARPTLVFHLAAQPLVRLSYDDPKLTFDTNVGGSVNLLECIRGDEGVEAAVVVTSDKCYENREWPYAYRENDAMGGHDPYSASKGCTELVTASFRRSIFSGARRVGLASARAGNVVGGGDWSLDRLIPDCVRALSEGRPVDIRNPNAVRPWQHVLDPLLGYLLLAARLLDEPGRFSQGYNFGPPELEPLNVGQLAQMFVDAWREPGDEQPDEGLKLTGPSELAPHEANLLRLSCDKAASQLGWRTVLTASRAIAWTVDWYRRHSSGEPGEMATCTRTQIDTFMQEAAAIGEQSVE